MQNEFNAKLTLRTLAAFVALALLATMVPLRLAAQDNDDPPTRAARLGQVDRCLFSPPANPSGSPRRPTAP
jgi:hypothetical protein